MPDIREEFEAWFLGKFYEGDKQCGLEWLSTEPCGGYRYQQPAELWEVWQASRAALKVELPEPLVPENNVSSKLIIGAYNALLEHVKEALQQAGIEVAQ